MLTLNKVTLLGNVGRNPEVKDTEKGKVATLSLATQTGYGDRATTEWHNLVAWEKRAEFIEKFVHSGSHIYVEGTLRTRSYEAKDGSKRYVTEILVNDVRLDDAPKAEQEDTPAPAQQAPAEEVESDLPY